MLSWQKLKIRTKIVLMLLPVLLPMLAIVAITYYSAQKVSLNSSGHLARQIVQTGAERTNDFLLLQDAKFQSWIQEDIYGLSIEFDTTKELGGRFQEMLTAAPEFSLLLLTDLGGKVLPGSRLEGLQDLGEVRVLHQKEGAGEALEEPSHLGL